VESSSAPNLVSLRPSRANWPSRMSHRPAASMIAAPQRSSPTAKAPVATTFISNPNKVSQSGRNPSRTNSWTSGRRTLVAEDLRRETIKVTSIGAKERWPKPKLYKCADKNIGGCQQVRQEVTCPRSDLGRRFLIHDFFRACGRHRHGPRP